MTEFLHFGESASSFLSKPGRCTLNVRLHATRRLQCPYNDGSLRIYQAVSQLEATATVLLSSFAKG